MYANLTIQLSRELDITSLRVWGAIYSLATLVLWCAVFARTLSLLPYGYIFESPCIEEIDISKKYTAENEKNQQGPNDTVYGSENGSGQTNGHPSGFVNGGTATGVSS